MNKFYIQIVFFLLCIFIYTNNKALATGPTPREQINKLYDTGVTPGEQSNKLFDAVLPPEVLNKRNREYALSPEFHAKLAADTRKKKTKEQTKEITKTKAKPKKTSYTPEEIYKQNKHLLCTNPEETINAENFMNQAVTQLEHHATHKDGYEEWRWNLQLNNVLYKKKHEDTIVQRILFQYFHSNKISEERTIIVMASPNINDHNSKNKDSYKNALIENANLFKTGIDYEDDITNGQLEKKILNIAGYLIEKKISHVNITYLEAIDGNRYIDI
ncbi:fam-a protein [Plasmodium vinckei brucechwatti]|uniref:Fam-a protein n=1 Tax=Plasmodium vinckei brucechwatti TaxID=119398 RepID=A0A6V7SEY5_PLAVN|nr:fam-a protein [Plasmodium vinckei brucechwatti]